MTSGLEEGAEGAVGVITMRTKPRGRKATPITDVTSTYLGEKEMAVSR
jgi:hypothetical protein